MKLKFNVLQRVKTHKMLLGNNALFSKKKKKKGGTILGTLSPKWMMVLQKSPLLKER